MLPLPDAQAPALLLWPKTCPWSPEVDTPLCNDADAGSHSLLGYL